MRRAAVAALAILVAACSDASEPEPPPRQRHVQELRLPTAEETEAATKFHEAEILLGAGKERAAEPLLRRVLALDPDHARASEALARCLVSRGAVDEAAPLLAKALAASPRNAKLRLLHIQALRNLGETAKSADEARAWTEADPQSDDAWFELGRASYALGRTEDAIAAFRRAETLKGARADVRSELGLALAAAGQLAKAEAKQRDALDRQPDYADAWFRLGDVILRRDRGRAKEAVEAMAHAVELEPNNVVAQLYLYRACRLTAESDAAMRTRGEEAWAAVLRIHGRAQIAAALGTSVSSDRRTSEFALREQVSLRPDDPAPRLALAHHLHADRRHDEAIEAYRRAIADGANDAATHVQLAAALVGRGDAAKASEELDTASNVAPGDGHVLRLRAWVLLLLDRPDQAAEAADAALAAMPGEVLTQKLKALATVRSGSVDEGLRTIASLGWL